MNLNMREVNKLLNQITGSAVRRIQTHGGTYPMFILFKKGKRLVISEKYNELPITSIIDTDFVEEASDRIGGAAEAYTAEDGSTIYTAYVTVSFSKENGKHQISERIRELVKELQPDMVMFLMTATYRDAKRDNGIPVEIDPESCEALFCLCCLPEGAPPLVLFKPLLRHSPVVDEGEDPSFEEEGTPRCSFIESAWTPDTSKVEVPFLNPYNGQAI